MLKFISFYHSFPILWQNYIFLIIIFDSILIAVLIQRCVPWFFLRLLFHFLVVNLYHPLSNLTSVRTLVSALNWYLMMIWCIYHLFLICFIIIEASWRLLYQDVYIKCFQFILLWLDGVSFNSSICILKHISHCTLINFGVTKSLVDHDLVIHSMSWYLPN